MSEFEASANNASAPADPLPSAPLRLRQAREATGLHIAALAAALKVPVRKLEALEAGRYDELPDMTFARALAASACRQLKVDPAAVLEQIPGAASPLLGGASAPINAPFKSSNEVAEGGLMAWLSRPVVWGAGLLLLAAVVVAVLPQGWVSRLQPVTAPDPVAAAPDLTVEPPVPTPTDEGATSDAPAGASSDGPAAAGPATDGPAAAPAAPPLVAGGELLSIRALTESWIEVVNGSGVQEVQRVLKPGEVLDFSTAPPYSVVLGRADAVQVTVRGQAFDVMPYARNSVARFEVK